MTDLTVSADLKARILRDGCFDEAENLRIYNKWFAKGPRYLFQAVNRKHHLTNKVLCDIGSSYGMNLAYCQPGSYGIEIDDRSARFANSIGLKTYKLDFMRGNIDSLPKVDVIWFSATLEHVESPHIFIRKMWTLLKPGGIVVIYVPTIPLIPALKYIPPLKHLMTGYLYQDHINAFVPSTMRFFGERAGFETLDCHPFYPPPLSILNNVPLLNRLIDGCVYVGRKIDDWDYMPLATRRATRNGDGFVYHDPSFKDPALEPELNVTNDE
ncbi:MAG: class I SAM-dependent methyltransferase [Anaerolineae bacterium]|nr:class I SAM-dependent methyltransferase [Anaerolineae bacterium]